MAGQKYNSLEYGHIDSTEHCNYIIYTFLYLTNNVTLEIVCGRESEPGNVLAQTVHEQLYPAIKSGPHELQWAV